MLKRDEKLLDYEFKVNKRPVTISIDEDLDQKIRKLQSQLVMKRLSGCSYSSTVNKILREGLKSQGIKNIQ